MHIADFSTGQLGANAIVGGSVPIATGAAMALRYLRRGEVVCCFAGDGAYANGVVLESLNWASQAQFTNFLAGDRPFGLPIIYLVQNNHYGMTHRTDDEVMGVAWLAQRAAGFSNNNMHAEVVNGMDVLAVRDAVTRADGAVPQRQGPGAHRGEHLPLLRPLPDRSAQRVSHQGRGGSLEGGRPDRPAGHSLGRRRPGRDGPGRGRAARRGAQRPRRQARRRRHGPRARGRADVPLHGHKHARPCRRSSRPRTSSSRCRPAKLTADGMLYSDALNDALVRGDGPRRARDLLRRGRGRLRRRVQGHQGPAGDLRARPRVQHAHLGGRASAARPWARRWPACGRSSS